MTDPIVVSRQGRHLRIRYPDPLLVTEIARDALLTTASHVRKNLSPQAAECYDEPTLAEAVGLFNVVIDNLATAHAAGYFHLPIRLSDVASWLLPALLQLGLSRGGFNAYFVWPDGRPMSETFAPWKEKGLLA